MSLLLALHQRTAPADTTQPHRLGRAHAEGIRNLPDRINDEQHADAGARKLRRSVIGLTGPSASFAAAGMTSRRHRRGDHVSGRDGGRDGDGD
jgi:hypothetical protein